MASRHNIGCEQKATAFLDSYNRASVPFERL